MRANKTALTILLVGLIGFLVPLAYFLKDLNDWNVIDQPGSISRIIFCVVSALVGMAGAAGIDIKTLLPSIFGSAQLAQQAKENVNEKASV